MVVGYYDDTTKKPTKRLLFVVSEESSVLFPQFENEPGFVQFSGLPHIDDNGDVIGLWLKKNEFGKLVKHLYKVSNFKMYDMGPAPSDWTDLYILGLNTDGIVLLADRKEKEYQRNFGYADVSEPDLNIVELPENTFHGIIALTDASIIGIYSPTFLERAVIQNREKYSPSTIFRIYRFDIDAHEDLKGARNITQIYEGNANPAYFATYQKTGV